jgi:hypothetical protein
LHIPDRRRIAVRTAAAFLILAVSTFIGEKARGETVIPLSAVGGKSHVAVRVGDVEIPDILLDTGFSFDGLMIYSPRFRDSLDLAGAVEVRIGGAGGGEASTALMLDSASFYLGDVEMTGQRILVLNGDRYRGFPSNGIIGYSIFGHYATELDNDGDAMILHPDGWAPEGGGWTAIPLYFKENTIPWLDASVSISGEEPVRLSMYIDYAAGDPVLLLEKPGMKFRLPEHTEGAHLGRGLSGDVYGKKGTISRLVIGPYELKDVTASFAPAGARSKQPGADGILGVGSLRRFDLVFDYAGKKLYIRPNGHFEERHD